MRELLKIWWPGVKLVIAIGAVSLIWSGLGWCYRLLAGWLPDVLFQSIAAILLVAFFPISIAIAVGEVMKPKK